MCRRSWNRKPSISIRFRRSLKCRLAKFDFRSGPPSLSQNTVADYRASRPAACVGDPQGHDSQFRQSNRPDTGSRLWRPEVERSGALNQRLANRELSRIEVDVAPSQPKEFPALVRTRWPGRRWRVPASPRFPSRASELASPSSSSVALFSTFGASTALQTFR